MTIDGLIAVLGLLLAAYAIMPRTRQLELRFRFTFFDWVAVGIAFLLILYLQFYSIFASVHLTPTLRLVRWNITPERASFLVALAAAFFVWLRLRYSRLSVNHVKRFSVLIDELLSSQSHRDLLALLTRNLDQLIVISRGHNRLSRLRKYLNPPSHDWLYLTAITEAPYSQWAPFLRRPMALLSRLIPSYSKEHDEALLLLQKIMTTKTIAAAIAKSEPYFGMRILEKTINHRNIFLDNYITSLLKHPSSVLYYETKNCPQVSPERGYAISEDLPFLNWLFADVVRAQRAEVYRPVGEAIIAELEELRRRPESDHYNFVANRTFEEELCWESPILIAILFFDIMVTSAFRQGVTFHMWLYYFTYFAKGVIENCSPNDPAIQNNDGSETRYGYLLRQIFFKLRDWAALACLVPDISDERARNLDINNDIPQSGASALALCFHYLLGSAKFEPRFKNEMASLIYGLYFDMRYSGRHNSARRLVALTKPNAFSYIVDGADYRDQLADTYRRFDQVPHRLRQPEYLDEFENLLLR